MPDALNRSTPLLAEPFTASAPQRDAAHGGAVSPEVHELIEKRLNGFAFVPAAEMRHRVEAHYRAIAADMDREMTAAERAHRLLVREMRTGIIDPQHVRRCYEDCLRAAERGERQMQILRFPNELCTDGGRAINNTEPDWPDTLTGIPRQVYEMWRDHLAPLGYRLAASIVAFPHGMPGDVGLFLEWD